MPSQPPIMELCKLVTRDNAEFFYSTKGLSPVEQAERAVEDAASALAHVADLTHTKLTKRISLRLRTLAALLSDVEQELYRAILAGEGFAEEQGEKPE